MLRGFDKAWVATRASSTKACDTIHLAERLGGIQKAWVGC